MSSFSNSRLSGLVIALVFLGALTWTFNWLLERQNNPNTANISRVASDGGSEVALTRNRQGHYVANGEINGQPVTFFLDTGATRVSIPATVADRLGLERGAAGFASTANGMVQVWDSRLDTARLGHIELHNVEAGINPGMAGPEILLGMSFLRHLELVQRGKTLTLRVPE